MACELRGLTYDLRGVRYNLRYLTCDARKLLVSIRYIWIQAGKSPFRAFWNDPSKQ